MSFPTAQTPSISSPIVGTQAISTITPRQRYEGHTSRIWGITHLPNGQRIITCSEDGSLRVWNLESGEQIGGEWRDGGNGVWVIALSPDGKKVVSGSEDGTVRLWDIDTGEVIAKWSGHAKTVSCVCWSRDGRRVASGSHDGTARQWDMECGESILSPIETGYISVHAVVYRPDTTMFATAGQHKDEFSVKIWHTKTGELLITLNGHTGSVYCLAWAMDGKTLISGSADHSITTWSTTTWEQIAILDRHTNIVRAIAISPNGRILASTSFDETARLWNLENGQPIGSPLQHADAVLSVSFSADGKLLATGCNDHNAYTWDISAILKEASLDNLLLDRNDGDKPLLDADIRHPAQQLEDVQQGWLQTLSGQEWLHTKDGRDLLDTPRLSDIILPPNTTAPATSQKQPQQQTNQGGPRHVIVTPPPNTQTTSQGQPQQVPNGLYQDWAHPPSPTKQTGRCTGFWCCIWGCICHCSCCSCYESNEC